MTESVQRKDWMEVVRLMKRDRRRELPQELRRRAVDETSKLCDDPVCLRFLVTHCDDDVRNIAVNNMVTRGRWSVVGEALLRGVSDSKCRWAIDEACKHASDDEFIDYILPHCADKQLDSVLTSLVERGMWSAVEMVLEKSVSYLQHGWANDKESGQDITFNMLRHRTDNQLDSVLTPLVERGLWSSVGTVLQRGVSDSQHRWAIDEACKQASDEEITAYILPHCADNQLDSVLTILVERGLWNSIGRMLERGVSDSQHGWAIDEACKHASEKEIIDCILLHCANNHLDSVLTILVKRGLWNSVGRVLDRGVSDLQHRWATEEVCKQASDEEIIDCILRHCTGNQLDYVLTPLVERSLWSFVGMVLQRGVSDSQRRWAIDEACKQASDRDIEDYILPLYATNQLDSVLTPLVERGRWNVVLNVLQSGVTVSDAQRRWMISLACRHASDEKIVRYILPHCADNQLDSVLTPLVERGLWSSVRWVLEQGISDSQHRWAIGEACKKGNNSDVRFCIQPYLTQDSLPQFIYDGANYLLAQLIKRGLWESAAPLLLEVVSETLYRWAVVEDNTDPDDVAFWNLVRNPWYGVRDLCKLCQIARCLERRWLKLSQRLDGLSGELCEVLTDSLLESVFEAWCTRQALSKEYKSTTDPSELTEKLHSEINLHIRSSTPVSDDTDSVIHKLDICIHLLCAEFSETTKYSDRTRPLFAVHFIKSLIKPCYRRRKWRGSTEGLLVILATVPVVPDVQSVVLRVMLRHKRWDVISHACLTHVWEQVRRQLFQAAVEQREWNAVTRWADHSLYDDQRGWALEEAFQEKQWHVFLLLADYGLVESELMCVHYRLAKHADWGTVLQLFERGGDVTDVKELLTGPKSRKAAYDKDDALKRHRRVSELRGLENDLNARKTALKTLKRAAKQGDWSVVLFSLQQRPVVHHIHLALKAAVANGVWHVVRQLIKLGIDTAQRDSLFTRMVKQRQWGVCMVLLEQGVSVELCLAALPELMDMDQWTLVAKVMMYDVDDAVRQQVMQRAMERKQGTVVWQCVITMHGDRLSVEERKELFQEALSREVLQATKPLIEVKDVIGIQHRDTVLPEAAEQHQWDVVDHCQLHHADIDMKDAEGHTPIHRAARKEDWEAVKALTKRGADPSLLDHGGESVLHRAITAKQWDTVKLLIQYHGDIHQVNHREETPLQMLIDACQGEIIEHTLMWCPDQWKGVNKEGETALHAVCLSGCPSALYYLVARGVDPQAVTVGGHSALSYAVIRKECPQMMVAECIKLGFCAYHPHVTKIEKPSTQGMRRSFHGIGTDAECETRLYPVKMAVVCGLPAVARMLYESGLCSYKDVFQLRPFLTDRSPGTGSTYYTNQTFSIEVVYVIGYDDSRQKYCSGEGATAAVKAASDYLMKVCSTPRSLKSSCRLVISRCVTVRRQRHRDATYAQLPLTEELRNYVMFSDITDPDYGQHETEGDEEHTDDNSDENYFSAEENLSFSEGEYFSFSEGEYFSFSEEEHELFKLRTKLPAIPSEHSAHLLHNTFHNELQYTRRDYGTSEYPLKKRVTESVTASPRYLMKVSSTPRSLKSSCRLVISRCVTVGRQRHRDATYAHLPLTEELMNYMMFPDPDYGQHETEGDEKKD